MKSTILKSFCSCLFCFIFILPCFATWQGGKGDGNNFYKDVKTPQDMALVWKMSLNKDTTILPGNIVSSGDIAITQVGTRIVGFNSETGEVKWYRDVDDKAVDNLFILNNMVISAQLSGQVSALKPDNGEIIWNCKLSGGIVCGATIGEKTLFFAAGNRNLDAVDIATGKLVASVDTKSTIKSSPILMGSSIVLAYVNGQMSRIENGIQKWSAEIDGMPRFETQPISDGKVIILTSGNRVIAVNPYDNQKPVKWESVINGAFSSMSMDDQALYITSADGRIYCKDISTGLNKWKKSVRTEADGAFRLPLGASASAVIMGGNLFVRMQYGVLAFYDKFTMESIWTYRIRSRDNSPALSNLSMMLPAIDNDSLFFASTDGNIFKLSAGAFDNDPPIFSGIRPDISKNGIVKEMPVSYLGAVIDDEGVGLARDTITLIFDRTDFSRNVSIDDKTGYAYIALDPAKPIPAGQHRMVMTAKDNRGNMEIMKIDFVTGVPADTTIFPVSIGGEVLPVQPTVTTKSIISFKNDSGETLHIVGDDDILSSVATFPEGIEPGASWIWIVPVDCADGARLRYRVIREKDKTEYATAGVVVVKAGI
jgi:outer membrane protein assembly factor BamB